MTTNKQTELTEQDIKWLSDKGFKKVLKDEEYIFEVSNAYASIYYSEVRRKAACWIYSDFDTISCYEDTAEAAFNAAVGKFRHLVENMNKALAEF